MKWRRLKVSSDGTHHEIDNLPAYDFRFDEVLKYHEPGLAPVKLGDQAWHIDTNGSPAYAARFLRTFGFYEGLSAVVAEDGWHHIDTAGNCIYDQRYSWVGNFQENLAAVRLSNQRYLHVSRQGSPAYENTWKYVGDFKDGIAVVQSDCGKSTHINKSGVLLHDCWFVDLDVFHKEFARAKDSHGWTHIDKSGKALYTQRYAMVEPFYNGQARVENFSGGMEVIDETGAQLVELRPNRNQFSELSADLVGFWKTRIICAAVELNIFEMLPASASEIADKSNLHVDRLVRLLFALGELKLVKRINTTWHVASRGEFLRRSHSQTLADAAIEYGKFQILDWEWLASALSIKSHWNSNHIFRSVCDDHNRVASHHRMLRSYALNDYAEVPEALALDRECHLIDAGAGTGILSKMIVDRYPSVRVTLIDYPEVVEQAMTTLWQYEGIQYRGIDFFNDWNLHADAVILARVLHDWEDLDALRILKNARSSLSAGGRIFIVEMLLDEKKFSGKNGVIFIF